MNNRTINGKTLDQIKKELVAPFPAYAVEKLDGKFTYIRGAYVRARLSKVLGWNYSIKIIEQEVITLKEPLKSKGQPVPHGSAVVTVEITILDDNGDIIRTVHGIGADTKQRGNSTNTSVDTLVKSAFTTALKNAAEQLGIGFYLRGTKNTFKNPPANTSNNQKKNNTLKPEVHYRTGIPYVKYPEKKVELQELNSKSASVNYADIQDFLRLDNRFERLNFAVNNASNLDISALMEITDRIFNEFEYTDEQRVSFSLRQIQKPKPRNVNQYRSLLYGLARFHLSKQEAV